MLSISKIDNLNISIKGEVLELAPIMKFLTIEIEKRMKNEVYKTNKRFFKVVSLNEIHTTYGFFDLIVFNVNSLGGQCQIDEELTKFERLEILPKWYEILNNPDYADSMGVPQYNYLYQLLGKRIGLGKYSTGAGKSEMQLAILESFQARHSEGNMLIIAPTNVIKDNFITRADKWDFICNDLDNKEMGGIPKSIDVNCRLNIINPTGFLSSHNYKYKNKEIFEWLNNVKCCVIDETHHAASTTWNKFCKEFLKNCVYLYSFSATPDSEKHITPYYTYDMGDWPLKLVETVSITGITTSEMKAENTEKLLTFTSINGTYSKLRSRLAEIEKRTGITDDKRQRLIDKELNYIKSLDETMTNEKFIEDFINFIDSHEDRTFYMLVHKIEIGSMLRNRIAEHFGYETSALFLDASGIKPDIGDISDMKKLISENKDNINSKVRIIISSTAGSEGMDIGDINGVIMIVGKNAKLTLQTAGRSRDEDTLLVMINDYGNPIILSQNKKRREMIFKEYAQGY